MSVPRIRSCPLEKCSQFCWGDMLLPSGGIPKKIIIIMMVIKKCIVILKCICLNNVKSMLKGISVEELLQVTTEKSI